MLKICYVRHLDNRCASGLMKKGFNKAQLLHRAYENNSLSESSSESKVHYGLAEGWGRVEGK